jgi:hypothetical protein
MNGCGLVSCEGFDKKMHWEKGGYISGSVVWLVRGICVQRSGQRKKMGMRQVEQCRATS